MKVIYEPHPVSIERKAELRKQGYKIIDAAFDPDPVKPEPVEDPKPVIRRGKRHDRV